MTASQLRKKYPEFIYRGYSYELKKGMLDLSFDFIVGDIAFHPRVRLRNISYTDIERIGEEQFSNLVFHIGLAEMPSYWKATASPRIIIEAGHLNKTQLTWWHTLMLKGMGQYFYENKIDFLQKDFLSIESIGNTPTRSFSKKLQKNVLLPIGGGKDAVVSYEILQAAKQKITPFILNPKPEQKALLRAMGEKNPIIVERTIDPKLLELNRKGYLNGHTPFSAYLAFVGVFCAALFNKKYIILSNEQSSNEGNVEWKGEIINHQYSKSFDFEKRFRSYSSRYLVEDAEYFSLLRPLYELQIAKLFAGYPKYFSHFLSCNEAHKTDSGKKKATGKWCGVCSKCLFVFATLYPFLEIKQLSKIFGSNLFDNKSLIPLMEELIGERAFKPFECVGTTKESLAAFYLSLQKTHPPLPPLLKHFRQHISKKYPNLPHEAKAMAHNWNNKHNIPPTFQKIAYSAFTNAKK